eukprot:scaffold22528_cov30-Tisochrysis_lutea.AAC.4
MPLRLRHFRAHQEEVLAGLKLEPPAIRGLHYEVQHVARRHHGGDELNLFLATEPTDDLVDDDEADGEDGIVPEGLRVSPEEDEYENP